MAEGEEIFVSYKGFQKNYKLRHKELMDSWYFDCECELCLADKGDRYETRGIMMGSEWLDLEYSAMAFSHPSGPRYGSTLLVTRPTITRLLKFATKINATYSSGRTAKPELSQIYFQLGDLWATSDASEALKVSYLSRQVESDEVLADHKHYETGYRHLEWDLYTGKEMKTSKRLVRKYGYQHLNFIEHARRLKAMKGLYQRKKMVSILLCPIPNAKLTMTGSCF
jgi:hypothetical protein